MVNEYEAPASLQAGLPARSISIEDLLAYQETVFLICLGFTRNQWDAQDLAQEAYLQAHQRLEQLRQPDAAKAWLCRITRNLCVDQIRRQRWRRFLDSFEEERSDVTPETLLLANEQVRQVKAAIEKLPAKLREVFVLNAYGELPYAEIAQILGIKIGTVMSRLSRARTKIKQEMEETR